MKRIRIGNPITVIWALTSDGAPIPVDEYGVQIIMSSANYRAEISPSDVEVGESALVIRISAEAQVLAGVYSLTARISNEAGVVATLDECNVFELVPRSCCGCTEDAGEVIINLGDEIDPGLLNKTLTLSVNGEEYEYNGRGDVDVPGFFAPTSQGASGQVLSGGESPSWVGATEALASDTTASEEVKGMAREAIDAQKEISVEVKPTGNIVLKGLVGGDKEFMPATPSGHPLHDAFVKCGGVWTPYDNLPDRLKDERSLANGGYWSYRVSEGGLEDITTAEFAKSYAFDPILSQRVPPLAMHSAISLMRTESGYISVQPRFNINRSRSSAAADYNGALNGSPTKSQNVMEVAWLSLNLSATATSIAYLCKNNSNLKRLNCNHLEISRCTAPATTTDAFVGCESLEFLHLQKIPKSINLGTLKRLANESILYAVNNVLPTATNVVLTLHPEPYARAMADPEIVAALEVHTNITLASA